LYYFEEERSLKRYVDYSHLIRIISFETSFFLKIIQLDLENLPFAYLSLDSTYRYKQQPIKLPTPNTYIKMVQTPEQRKRNLKFAKEQDAKRGKPTSAIKKKDSIKSPVAPWVIVLLIFAVFGSTFGPMLFEAVGRIFGR